MINTMDVAIEVLTGELDVCDLINDVEFLSSVDNSMKSLFDNNLYSGTHLTHKRKLILDKISALTDGDEIQ